MLATVRARALLLVRTCVVVGGALLCWAALVGPDPLRCGAAVCAVYYGGVVTGGRLSHLRQKAKFPDHPDEIRAVTVDDGCFETHARSDTFGAILEGWVRPFETGPC